MTNDLTKLNRLASALEECARLDRVLSLATLQVFLYLATHPSCAMADICESLDIAQPAATRHLQRLQHGSPSKAVGAGLNLVTFVFDKEDTRRRLYTLSEGGRELIKKMAAAL